MKILNRLNNIDNIFDGGYFVVKSLFVITTIHHEFQFKYHGKSIVVFESRNRPTKLDHHTLVEMLKNF